MDGERAPKVSYGRGGAGEQQCHRISLSALDRFPISLTSDHGMLLAAGGIELVRSLR